MITTPKVFTQRFYILPKYSSRNNTIFLQKKQKASAFNTYSNKDVLLAAKNKRIKVLEDEVKHLKEQLKRLGGELYEKSALI